LAAVVARADCDNPSLVIDEKAEGVQYRGCWQVEYVVKEGFPAANLLQRLTRRLLQQGWRKLEIDPTDPSARDAPVHVWATHHMKDQAGTRVDQWLGWFIRDDQSRLQLTCRYLGRSAKDPSPLPVYTTVTFVTPREWERRPK
jgi:hypothetical protein